MFESDELACIDLRSVTVNHTKADMFMKQQITIKGKIMRNSHWDFNELPQCT